MQENQLIRIATLIDQAIKHPFEMVDRDNAVIRGFVCWMKANLRHTVPITYKSEWSILSVLARELPKVV
jgi:hypothetical protein